jgi:hypothetical protein
MTRFAPLHPGWSQTAGASLEFVARVGGQGNHTQVLPSAFKGSLTFRSRTSIAQSASRALKIVKPSDAILSGNIARYSLIHRGPIAHTMILGHLPNVG